jgi:hypothetical protein
MGIGRALARGLRDASAGIARGSRNWPQRRAEQARLAQQQEEFDATHALREREQVRLEEDAARSAAQGEYELLLSQVQESRQGLEMYLEAGADPEMLREQWNQHNALTTQLNEFTIDRWGEQTMERTVDEIMAAPPPVEGPRGARFGEDEFVSDVSPPPAPEGQQAQVPRLRTTDLEGPPSVQKPVDDLVLKLSKRFVQDRHNSATKMLTKTATDIGADAAMTHYFTAMGTYATPKLTEAAKELFEDYAAGTLPERRKARAAVITAAIKAAADPKETAFPVWKTLNEVILRDHGGWRTPEEALVVWERMAATDLKLDISGENQTRMGRINAIKFTLASSLAKMSDPDIAKAFGGLAGLEMEFNRRLLNWVDTPPGEKLTPWVLGDDDVEAGGEKAMQIISTLNEMKIEVDLVSRLQSGAALTEDEVIFYSGLIGSISTDPAIIRQNMKDLMQTMIRMEEGIVEASYVGQYGMEHILTEVQERTGNVPFGVPKRTPTVTAPADTTGGGSAGLLQGLEGASSQEDALMDSVFEGAFPGTSTRATAPADTTGDG